MFSTRDEYQATVNRPGQFEGEAPWVPYFWDVYLAGMADDDDGETLFFTVDATDAAMFPELTIGMTVCLEQRDDGFVNGWISEPID